MRPEQRELDANSQVSSCATAGTTSCIQLRTDAVGYAVTQLLSHAQTVPPRRTRTRRMSFASASIRSSRTSAIRATAARIHRSVGLTATLNGTTINNFAFAAREPARHRKQFHARFRRHPFRKCVQHHELERDNQRRHRLIDQPVALPVPDHRRLAGLPDPVERRLELRYELVVHHASGSICRTPRRSFRRTA